MSGVMHNLFSRVKFLTLLAASLLAVGCAYIRDHMEETCKSHAHVRMILSDYLSRRFHTNSPVRLAIIPFSVPANLAAQSAEREGTGDKLAWLIHQDLLHSDSVPIVEVLNRPDWPGKKEEFFTGNFGAISMAREAGYDLVMVGFLEPMRSTDQMVTHSKIIEVASGITVWYGTVTAVSNRRDVADAWALTTITQERPDLLYYEPLLEKLAYCISQAVTSEKE